METKILLVDDEEGIRKVLGISLMDIGYQVLTAENGKDGLDVFRQHAPPIVLTDIKMPSMDGIELLQQIKAESPDTEVVMLTGHGDMDLAIKCLKLEATDFITKPINDDILEIALKRANDRIDMRKQLRAYTENLEKLVEEQSARLVKAERLAAVGGGSARPGCPARGSGPRARRPHRAHPRRGRAVRRRAGRHLPGRGSRG